MAKIDIPDIATQFASTTAINNRMDQIELEFNEKVLYRDNPEGEPNNMESDLDMDYKRIFNLPIAVTTGEPVTFGQVIGIVEDIANGGDGSDGNISFTSEVQTLTSGQTEVTFISDLTLATFALSGVATDSRQLVEEQDYEITYETRTITLYNSYPAGTVVRVRKENTDDLSANENAIQAAADAQEWAIRPEDDPIPVENGGDGVTTFSALHWAAKAAAP